jgi:hypothetical protein
MFARFALLPDQGEPVQRSWLTAALSMGTKIIQLRHLCPRLGVSHDLGAALDAVARGNCAVAIAKLAEIDAALTTLPGEAALRARSLILAISEVLTQHASYFDAGAPG